jgi:hypothetical protein
LVVITIAFGETHRIAGARCLIVSSQPIQAKPARGEVAAVFEAERLLGFAGALRNLYARPGLILASGIDAPIGVGVVENRLKDIIIALIGADRRTCGTEQERNRDANAKLDCVS